MYYPRTRCFISFPMRVWFNEYEALSACKTFNTTQAHRSLATYDQQNKNADTIINRKDGSWIQDQVNSVRLATKHYCERRCQRLSPISWIWVDQAGACFDSPKPVERCNDWLSANACNACFLHSAYVALWRRQTPPTQIHNSRGSQAAACSSEFACSPPPLKE
jgi:hypothetical protein